MRINRRMGFLKEFALAQKLICHLLGTIVAGWHVNVSTVGADILEKVLYWLLLTCCMLELEGKGGGGRTTAQSAGDEAQ